MRVIGIDPGIERTGFAILEELGSSTTVLDFGFIRTPAKTPLSTRLNMLSGDLASLLKEWKPSIAGVEQLFFSRNVKTAMTVSHARGVILETLEEHGVGIFEYNPGTIKLAVTGDARADKAQVKKMVELLVGVTAKNDDTMDAIACGLCLLQSYKREACPQ